MATQTVEFEGYAKGMNNILDDHVLGEDQARNIINWDVDDRGRIRVRQGRNRIYTGTIVKGTMWSDGETVLFVEGGDLKRLESDNTATTLRTGVGDFPMSYVERDKIIYYTNRVITGKVVNGSDAAWGVTPPPRQPTLVAGSSGNLDAGVYQVAITFIALDGEESGTPLAAEATVVTGGSILLRDIPAPATGKIRVYVSAPNGTVLYFLREEHKDIPTILINDVNNLTEEPLETQFGEPPIPANLIEYHGGKIYMAVGPVVWATEPLRYGLVKPSMNFFFFGADVSILAGVDDGLYIVADRHYWLSDLAESPNQIDFLDYGAVRRTAIRLPDDKAVAWFSEQGLVIGKNGGAAANVTMESIAVSDYDFGTMLYREHEGIKQIVATMQTGMASSYPAPAWTVDEVARKGNSV